jgi:hypothetical protein
VPLDLEGDAVERHDLAEGLADRAEDDAGVGSGLRRRGI